MKGDDIMVNELFAYMKQRADKLVEKDEVKQKTALVRKQLFESKGIVMFI